MVFLGKLRDGVRSYFNPSKFDPVGFRNAAQSGLTAIALADVTVYIMLQQSARLGEIPSYTNDIVIMSLATLEFFLGPFIGWLGFRRRRNIMVMWITIALVCTLPVFGTPIPATKPDTALCTIQNHFLPSGMTPRLAIRLSILVLIALACALSRLAVTAHGLAYLDEDQPSFNTHMNLAIFLLVRVVLLHVGPGFLRSVVEDRPWLQPMFAVFNFLRALLLLFKSPVMPAAVDTSYDGERSLCRSLGRVLRNKMVLLQILAMGLLGAAVWGYGFQEEDVVMVKFHSVASGGWSWQLMGFVRVLLIIIVVVLSGYLYTGPVMPVYDKYRALSSAARLTASGVLVLLLMLTVSCSKVTLSGMGESTYTQPACGLQCGCDRPWTSFSPVCDAEGMTTYFSPCHAGCSTAEATSGVGFYSNCTCAGGARVTVGACEDGSCAAAYAVHTLLFTCVIFCALLALIWQGTVLLESVDRRDKSVAVGLASGTVSLFTFVGGHALYMWFSDSTCAVFERSRCLLHSSRFVSLVTFTTIGLVSAALAITIAAAVILYRQQKNHQQIENMVREISNRSKSMTPPALSSNAADVSCTAPVSSHL